MGLFKDVEVMFVPARYTRVDWTPRPPEGDAVRIGTTLAAAVVVRIQPMTPAGTEGEGTVKIRPVGDPAVTVTPLAREPYHFEFRPTGTVGVFGFEALFWPAGVDPSEGTPAVHPFEIEVTGGRADRVAVTRVRDVPQGG